jgi:hypothetical protein
VGPVPVTEPPIGVVQEQEILALDIEDERLGISSFMAENFRTEEAEEQEACVASLGGDARDARNIHVRTAPAVKKREIEIDGKAVTREAGGESLLHAIEMEREVAVLPGDPKHDIAGARRHPGFRFDAGGDNPRATRDFERQHALVGKEDIAFETAALVLGADQIYETGNLDMLVAGNQGPHCHDIVELKMCLRIDSDPPLERC